MREKEKSGRKERRFEESKNGVFDAREGGNFNSILSWLWSGGGNLGLLVTQILVRDYWARIIGLAHDKGKVRVESKL